MNPDITHGETCQLVHHYDDHSYDDHSYGHEQVQMGPYDDGHSQWRCGRCHAVLLSHAGATPEPAPSEATPLTDAAYSEGAIETSKEMYTSEGRAKHANMGWKLARTLERALSASRREVAALKAERDGWKEDAKDAYDLIASLRAKLAAKTAEASDLAAKSARGAHEHIKTIKACNELREQRDDLAAKHQRAEAEQATREKEWHEEYMKVLETRDAATARALAAEAAFLSIKQAALEVYQWYRVRFKLVDNPTEEGETLEKRIIELADVALSKNTGQPILDRLKRAEADANRLDWLESTKSAVEYYGAPMWMCEDALGVEILGKGNSVREAIDAATQRKDA